MTFLHPDLARTATFPHRDFYPTPDFFTTRFFLQHFLHPGFLRLRRERPERMVGARLAAATHFQSQNNALSEP
jgi:hypothetical protein